MNWANSSFKAMRGNVCWTRMACDVAVKHAALTSTTKWIRVFISCPILLTMDRTVDFLPVGVTGLATTLKELAKMQ